MLLANNGEQEGGEEGLIEEVDGFRYVFVEQLEIVCAARIWEPGVSGIVHYKNLPHWSR